MVTANVREFRAFPSGRLTREDVSFTTKTTLGRKILLMKYKIVVAATVIGTVGGLTLAVCSYLFTGEFVTWGALGGVYVAVQSQLGFILFRLGDISGQLKRMK